MLRNIKNEKLYEEETLAFQLGLIELKGALKVFDVVIGSGEINVSDKSKAFMEKFINDYKEIDDIIKEKKNTDMEDVARFESMPLDEIWMLIKNVGAFGSEKERESLKNLLTVSNNLNISAVVPESDRKILGEVSYENENISSFSNFLEECMSLKQTNSFKEKNKLAERIKENKVFKNNENLENLNKDMKNLYPHEVEYIDNIINDKKVSNEDDFIKQKTHDIIFDKLSNITKFAIIEESKKVKNKSTNSYKNK